MRARTTVVVDGGRVTRLRCQPPLTVRAVDAADGHVGLCLVGTAAGPLPGDDLELALDLAGAVDLQATGASLALGGGAGHGAVRIAGVVRDGAHLRADPGALIVCAGADVRMHVRLDLATTASVEWHELVVLGRAGEPGGRAALRWDVTRADQPVLRQLIDLRDERLRGWTGMTGGRRVIASSLLSGPDVAARTVVHSEWAAAQRVAADTVLITVLADDAATAVRRRGLLLAEFAPALPAGRVAGR